MSVATQLGLGSRTDGLLGQVPDRWSQWQKETPLLADYLDLHDLRERIVEMEPDEANRVLLVLAERGAVDGGDDPVATAALLWLLLPGAVNVARSLASASDRIDELVASQLWICARTVSWRRGVRVAATVLKNTRREVVAELLIDLARRSRAKGTARGSGGLLSRATATEVAEARGISRPTVSRRASRTLHALREHHRLLARSA